MSDSKQNKHDSEIKKILQAARTLPFRFDKSKATISNYRRTENAEVNDMDKTANDQNVVNLNKKLNELK